jgi:hypothetical protein
VLRHRALWRDDRTHQCAGDHGQESAEQREFSVDERNPPAVGQTTIDRVLNQIRKVEAVFSPTAGTAV